MKVAVVFILFLCFHLLGRYDYANAAHHLKPFYSVKQNKDNPQQAAIVNDEDGFVFTATDGIKDGKDHLISVEEEDEEELVSRKSILLDKYFSAFFYAFIAAHSFNHSTKDFSSYKRISNTGNRIYLEQSVLRI